IEENEEHSGFMGSIYNNVLYGGYKLHGTETGRMSGGGGLDSSINYQNMPTPKEFRKLFLPHDGYVIGKVDYDAMEVAIASQISGAGVLEELILSGKDPHSHLAVGLAKLLNWETTYEEVYQKAKIEKNEKFVDLRDSAKGLQFQCLAAETKIRTNKGILRIDEIVPLINIGKFTPYFGDIKLLNRNNTEMSISHTIYKQNCELLDIELEDGTIISVTPDHEILIIRKGIELKILASELTNKDELVSI
ncbi:MAG: hypothetical protein PHF86_14330, partial [Candidatus Nanoarchaeia archaeon]|nr:hypothetical protein [Candidatus Nanoarchaeia archaeon]